MENKDKVWNYIKDRYKENNSFELIDISQKCTCSKREVYEILDMLRNEQLLSYTENKVSKETFHKAGTSDVITILGIKE